MPLGHESSRTDYRWAWCWKAERWRGKAKFSWLIFISPNPDNCVYMSCGELKRAGGKDDLKFGVQQRKSLISLTPVMSGSVTPNPCLGCYQAKKLISKKDIWHSSSAPCSREPWRPLPCCLHTLPPKPTLTWVPLGWDCNVLDCSHGPPAETLQVLNHRHILSGYKVPPCIMLLVSAS